MNRTLPGLAAACFALAFAAPAAAQVTLPNGMVVPVASGGGEVQLSTLFPTRGESIDWVADARPAPDTFSPLCSFTAELVLKQSASVLGVGWYNVDPGGAAPTEVYEIVPAGSPVGTTITGTSIRDDARYAGGLVGFALIRVPPHYTEARWNTVCDSGPCASTPGPWILSLSYPSTVEENAWYVAFEDGDTSSSSWNNDGDYNDYVFFFTGVSCPGGAEPCTVPDATGICAAGLTECGVGGALSCRPQSAARAESCDGADEDCDGAVDEGDALCGGLDVCLAGTCVPPCFEGSCPAGQTCSDDLCVDDACLSMTCDEGLACREGRCVAPCDDVVCPGAQVCRVGRCVDACEGVSCDEGFVCEAGVCVDRCECRGCAIGSTCQADGSCLATECVGVDCAAGEVCRGGTCVDACDGAVCPSGQICEAGACIDEPPGTLPDSGAGSGTDGGGAGGVDGGSTGGVDGGDGTGGDGDDEGGCGCRSAGRGAGDAGWLLLGLALVWRRKRR
ncbi:MAG: hypothetical protein CMN30_16750 [Sandaracinus sp.]|nr:hypothetical protein [Sandaracinus sp.]